MENKIFKFALITSLILHVFMLVSLIFTDKLNIKKKPKIIEIVYQFQQKSQASKERPQKKLKSIKEKKLTPRPEILTKKQSDFSSVFGDIKKKTLQLKAHQKQSSRPPQLGGERQISVPMLKSEKITNPKYVNYHERIRAKIKNRAYFYVDDPQFQAGEVYLTFVISSDGQLKKVKIIDQKTSANNYLRTIGLRSIKESNPFPPFPPDLSYPELTFNVIISFELDE